MMLYNTREPLTSECQIRAMSEGSTRHASKKKSITTARSIARKWGRAFDHYQSLSGLDFGSLTIDSLLDRWYLRAKQIEIKFHKQFPDLDIYELAYK